MGTDWRDNDPAVEPMVEIYQGDRQNYERPGAPRCPTAEYSIGGWEPLGFVNLALMGLGADIYGAGTLTTGLVFASLILPFFVYRHYIQDKGVFPSSAREDLLLDKPTEKRAGVLPYVALAVGVAVVIVAKQMAVY